MKRIAVLIEVAPESGPLNQILLSFLESGRAEVDQIWVFLYGDGVLHARSKIADAAPLTDYLARWKRLSADPKLTLVACVTAAERRGVTDDNLARGFRLGGLGEWTEAMASADRVIQFR